MAKTSANDGPTDVAKAKLAEQGQAAPAVNDEIGSVLRGAFRATVEEEVPDSMLDLLRRLS